MGYWYKDVVIESDSNVVTDNLLDLCTSPMVVSNILTSVTSDKCSSQVSRFSINTGLTCKATKQ